MRIRTYSELSRLSTFEERFDYLSLPGIVGESTFGFDRYINQQFYRSTQWRRVRNQVIARDEGSDLGIPGREIYDRIIIHHMNPMALEDIMEGDAGILEVEFLITTTHRTHNAIHYGDKSLLVQPYKERIPGDTRLW